MRDEAERLESSNKMLQDRFTTIQNDATKLHREKNALQSEVADLKRQLEAYQRSEQSARNTAGKSDEDSRAQIMRLQRQLDEAREETTKKVQDTAQFQQMKQMMQTQSAKLRDLR
jgi:hypothetical protein